MPSAKMKATRNPLHRRSDPIGHLFARLTIVLEGAGSCATAGQDRTLRPSQRAVLARRVQKRLAVAQELADRLVANLSSAD